MSASSSNTNKKNPFLVLKAVIGSFGNVQIRYSSNWDVLFWYYFGLNAELRPVRTVILAEM